MQKEVVRVLRVDAHLSYIPPCAYNRFMNHAKPSIRHRRGVVGVIFRDDCLLVIRRSMTVAAPGMLCLPGGGIELGESEPEALVREMQEELAIDVDPIQLCWRSVTAWGTNLAWWLAHLDDEVTPVANPAEVAEFHWMTVEQIRGADNMLPSLPAFMDAWGRGEVDLTR
ncbi:MAG: NUDIX domain-containing protein [Planctomycetota bacterium]|nr:NUDIX domain-containing protein [Planctomycetota bacterium]